MMYIYNKSIGNYLINKTKINNYGGRDEKIIYWANTMCNSYVTSWS